MGKVREAVVFLLGLGLGLLFAPSSGGMSASSASSAPSSFTDGCTPTNVLHHSDARPLSTADAESIAQQHMATAAQLSGAKGQGREGWLQLLAAFDADPADADIVRNLCENYHRAQFPELAEDALRRTLATLDAAERNDAVVGSSTAVATADAPAWRASRQEVASLMRAATHAMAALPRYRHRGREMASAADSAAHSSGGSQYRGSEWVAAPVGCTFMRG